MRLFASSLLIASVVTLSLAPARDTAACGGCFHNDIQQMENTLVTGHRMLLSISKTQSTLWDQIQYSGNPTSFAWVLPVKGMIDIGVSSDALFEALDQSTQVTVSSPVISCPPPPFCGDGVTGGSSGSGGAGGAPGGGVDIIAEIAVGPYQTAQLSSQDPLALTSWLNAKGYVIPPEIQPIIDAYVAEGFDFLAVKLLPGMGVQSMKPMRVTSQGASPALPLRMVSAGTGAMVPITLWMVSEGAYEPSNFPSFTITEDQLVWDWDTMSSNYKALRTAGFDAAKGKSWIIEASEPMSPYSIIDPLMFLAEVDPLNSGYADDMGLGAPDACAADMATLFAGISEPSTWVGRIHAELPRSALADDLNLMASPDQSPVQRSFTAQKTIGTAPKCPVYPPCPPTSGSSSSSSGSGGSNGAGGAGSRDFGNSCALGASNDASSPLGMSALALAAMVALGRRRARARG